MALPKRTAMRSITRLLPSIIFPTIFFGAILWDLNNTRIFKEQQKQLLQESQKN